MYVFTVSGSASFSVLPSYVYIARWSQPHEDVCDHFPNVTVWK